MKRLTMMTATGIALVIGATTPVSARTIHAECQTLFDEADQNNDGALGNGEANPFAKAQETSSTLSKLSNTVSEEEFLAECGAQVLQKMPTNQLAMVFILVSASARAAGLLSPE